MDLEDQEVKWENLDNVVNVENKVAKEKEVIKEKEDVKEKRGHVEVADLVDLKDLVVFVVKEVIRDQVDHVHVLVLLKNCCINCVKMVY